MQDNLQFLLSEIESDIKSKNIKRCHELTATFKSSFTDLSKQPNITQEQFKYLEGCLASFGELVQLLHLEKKLVASKIAEFKQNNSKLSKYNQFK